MLVLLGSEGGDARDTARALLAHGLLEYFGLGAIPETARGRCGKPWFPAYPGLHFNLSHSGKFALCALSDSPVGVDIEEIRPRTPSLAAFSLNRAEYRWYEVRGGGWESFYTLWTRKESWCKYAGESILQPQKVCPPLPGGRAETLAVHSLSGDGWRAAVCTAERENPNILWKSVTK